MYKDYGFWMKVKKEINNLYLCPVGFKEREIWYASIGENVGCEEDGKNKRFARPVLILKKFNCRLCLGIPLSSKEKIGKYYYSFDGNTGKISVAILSQIKSLDSTRLLHKIGKIEQRDFLEIKRKLIKILDK